MKSAEEAGAPPARPGGENNSLPEPAKRLGLFRHVIEVRAGQCAAHGSGVGVKEHLEEGLNLRLHLFPGDKDNVAVGDGLGRHGRLGHDALLLHHFAGGFHVAVSNSTLAA